MNFNIDISSSLINNQNHLLNLHKHITRTAKKYDVVKDKVFVEIIKPMDANLRYNKNLVHVVIQPESHDYDDFEMTYEVFKNREDLEIVVSRFIGEFLVKYHPGIKELTIVAGAQPDGSYIAPCVHIIYEVYDINDENIFVDLISSVEVLDRVIAER